MNFTIISPFPPYRGGISKETEVLCDSLILHEHKIKIITSRGYILQFYSLVRLSIFKVTILMILLVIIELLIPYHQYHGIMPIKRLLKERQIVFYLDIGALF